MRRNQEPDCGESSVGTRTAKVIQLPIRRRRTSAVPTLAELEDTARWALGRHIDANPSAELKGLQILGQVAFEACMQVRLDDRVEAINIAAVVLEEMLLRIRTLAQRSSIEG